MSAPALPLIDAGLPALLRRLQAAAAPGPLDARTLAAAEARQLADPMALLGALCLGGTELALQVAALANPAGSADDHLGAVIAAPHTPELVHEPVVLVPGAVAARSGEAPA